VIYINTHDYMPWIIYKATNQIKLCAQQFPGKWINKCLFCLFIWYLQLTITCFSLVLNVWIRYWYNIRKAYLIKWRTCTKLQLVILQNIWLKFLISYLYENVVRKIINTTETFHITFEFDKPLLNKIIDSEWVRHQVLCQYCCNE
jgi:hypothetical protein